MTTKKLIKSFVIHSIIAMMVLTSSQGVSADEVQSQCKPFPNTKDFDDAIEFFAYCVGYLFWGGGSTCATNAFEVACQAAYSPQKTVEVCDETTIMLSEETGTTFSIQTGIFKEDKKIVCAGCDCTIGRVTSKKFSILTSKLLCPYFTTNSLDSKLELKGFRFKNYKLVYSFRNRRYNSYELDETPEQYIIGISNIPSIFNPTDPIDEELYDIKIKSEHENKECAAKSSKSNKGDKKNKSAAPDMVNDGGRHLLQKTTEKRRMKEGIKGLRRQAQPVKRQLQETTTGLEETFCNDDFFLDEDTEEMAIAAPNGTVEEEVEVASVNSPLQNALYHLCTTLASNPDAEKGIALTLDSFSIFQEEEDPNEKILQDLIINAGLNDTATSPDEGDFDVEGDALSELPGQITDEYVATIWEAAASEIGTNANGEITSNELNNKCSSLFSSSK
mmetsp:Transcript_17247/g.26690  ORF Transcript_17247/g.26690 Transcript_17247/m.26690 type:complete len:446 (-) Transcript_17247:138-1475(-)|eukprot:CAMPEP_0195282134 /NCGR_PEP_ID=MMETSP0707-20130614/1147_1 /TAXON_ID=33640 /ORGANISM="Asterionellopsis glacialis, Strain CCMP134" /LENGTH=445 /DNA_ID=CAMNT_0040341087 /DNA_START=154 /DNA_END=1491 /DNA_ORIENTATION=-